MCVDVLRIPIQRAPRNFRLNFDISSGNLNVSCMYIMNISCMYGNTSMVTQDLCGKVIISECYLIAAIEQTNKIGRTFISAKALSMDIRTSAAE